MKPSCLNELIDYFYTNKCKYKNPIWACNSNYFFAVTCMKDNMGVYLHHFKQSDNIHFFLGIIIVLDDKVDGVELMENQSYAISGA